MTEVIVLDPDEAEKVRGMSPKAGHALDPIPLKDGRFYLGQEVFDDPAHQDVRPFLGALPLLPYEKLPVFTAAEFPEVERYATKLRVAGVVLTDKGEVEPIAGGKMLDGRK